MTERKDTHQRKINKRSIYLNLLLHGRSLDKMNSLSQAVEKEERMISRKDEYNAQKATFTIQPPNTNLSIQRTLTCVSNIERQDLFQWKNEFLETSKLCKWDEATASTVLESIVNTEYLPIIRQSINIMTQLNALLKHKYPLSQSFTFAEELSNMRQEKFYTIENYMKQIEKLTNILGVARDYNPDQIRDKIEETFYTGLADETKLEMTRLNIHSFGQIYQIINETEKLVIQQNRSIERKFYEKTQQRDADNSPKGKPKYCKLHKTSTHSDQECRSQQRNTHKENKTYALVEEHVKPRNIELNVTINEQKFKALIDTGSVYNYITQETIDRAKLETVELSNVAHAEMANGATIQIKDFTKTQFKIDGNPNVIYQDEFRVIPSSGASMILGMNFLQKNDAIINIKEGYINLDGLDVEILEWRGTDTMQAKVIQKSKIHVCQGKNTRTESDQTSIHSIQALIEEAKTNNPALGHITHETHKITTHKDVISTGRQYTVPASIWTETLELLNDLREKKIIRKSQANIYAPAFIIKKKNGNLRMVVDYRELNKVTTAMKYPIPEMHNFLSDLKGSKTFSQIDLSMGYYQIPIEVADIHKTAFILANEIYEFTRMPFGLTNAPRTFQRVMNQILGDLHYVKIYLDDILIHSKSMEEHVLHLKTVFQRLASANASINFEKSNFAQNCVKYLGNEISEKGIKPDVSRVDVFNKLRPVNTKQLQSLIGFINWFRPFVKNLSSLLTPITSKLQKNLKFQWKEADTERINEIFQKIKEATLLNYPDYNKPFKLEVDANEEACGGVLYQTNGVIGIYSRKFNSTELNYTIIEKETLAIMKCVEHFKPIIFNGEITIYTDNMNIIAQKAFTKRINRWKLLLEEYNYTLEHISTQQNKAADGLTRICPLLTNTQSIKLNLNEIANFQKYLTENSENRIVVCNGTKILTDQKGKVIIPTQYTIAFLKKLHEELAHPGANKLRDTLFEYFKIQNLARNSEEITKQCSLCMTNKLNISKYGKVSGGIESNYPFEVISSDIVGPIKTRHFQTTIDERFFYILTISDIFSRWTKISIIKDIKSSTICREVNNYLMKRNKTVKRIITDQGRQYMSENFKALLTSHGIQHKYTTSHNPTGNSISERINGQINDILRIYKGESLNRIKERIETRLNMTNNKTLGCTPHEIVFKASPYTSLPLQRSIDIKDIKQKIRTCVKESENNTNTRRRSHIYHEGDRVYKRNFSPDKIDPKWKGPYQITKIHGDNNVWIHENNKLTKQNIKNLRPCFEEGVDVVSQEANDDKRETDKKLLINLRTDKRETDKKLLINLRTDKRKTDKKLLINLQTDKRDKDVANVCFSRKNKAIKESKFLPLSENDGKKGHPSKENK